MKMYFEEELIDITRYRMFLDVNGSLGNTKIENNPTNT
jgi:hypothetical protein